MSYHTLRAADKLRLSYTAQARSYVGYGTHLSVTSWYNLLLPDGTGLSRSAATAALAVRGQKKKNQKARIRDGTVVRKYTFPADRIDSKCAAQVYGPAAS